MLEGLSIRGELEEISKRFADKRRTKIGGAGGDDVEFQAEDFIVDEAVTVILSRDGWLKRACARSRISRPRACARAMRYWPHCAVEPRTRSPSSPISAVATSFASTTFRPPPVMASPCKSCSTSAMASA